MLIVENYFFCCKHLFNKLDLLALKKICNLNMKIYVQKLFEIEAIKFGEVLTSSCLGQQFHKISSL